jgi:hypothetical protein
MGRNTLTARQAIEIFAQRIRSFENSMNDEDMNIFEDMILKGRIHASQMDLSRISTESAFILSVIIEILKQMRSE